MDGTHPKIVALPLEPRLPQELERFIFELAARSDRSNTLFALMLVAHRVRAWVDPIRFEIMMIGSASWFRTPPKNIMHRYRLSHPSGLQGALIGHLLYDTSDDSGFDWNDFLPTCYNLQSLAIWGGRPGPLGSTLQTLTTLTRSSLRTVSPSGGLFCLSACLTHLFPGGNIDWTHPVLKDLTHLDVLDQPHELGEWVEENSPACLKRLRYLLFGDINTGHPSTVDFLTKCLERCSALELMILPGNIYVEKDESLLPQTRRILGPDGTVKTVPEDRVVINDSVHGFDDWVIDWYRGATGGEDIWIKCEMIAKQRRRSRDIDGALGQVDLVV
ncbi:hypothetical protein AX16_007122 [Volvariella volvacea WC 439]|nr:hypothetical protein AX16_007122 [Volvariella volvacea WC 439]